MTTVRIVSLAKRLATGGQEPPVVDGPLEISPICRDHPHFAREKRIIDWANMVHHWIIARIGREAALAALEAGDPVVATARHSERLAKLAGPYSERILPIELDVTVSAAAVPAVQAAVARFGRIDVLVNNAGYANVAPIETASADDFRRQFDTNFWGAYNVTRAALPIMRRQCSGTIVQISSIEWPGRGTPGQLGSYQAAKFAADGSSRVLAAEVASLVSVAW